MIMGLITEELDVIQSDLDDESPQLLGALVEKLLDEGALDAHLTSLQMKKGRPGVRVELLCHPDQREGLVELLLKESSTLGVKAWRVQRYSLPRHIDRIVLESGEVRIKVATLNGRVIRAMPEFEDCRRLAETSGRRLRDVHEEAKAVCQAMIGVEGQLTPRS